MTLELASRHIGALTAVEDFTFGQYGIVLIGNFPAPASQGGLGGPAPSAMDQITTWPSGTNFRIKSLVKDTLIVANGNLQGGDALQNRRITYSVPANPPGSQPGDTDYDILGGQNVTGYLLYSGEYAHIFQSSIFGNWTLYIAGIPFDTTTKRTYTAPQTVAPVLLDTSGPIINSDANVATSYRVVLSGNGKVLARPQNLVDGMQLTFIIVQDSTGGHDLTFAGAFKFPGAGSSPPTITQRSNAVDMIRGYYSDAEGVIFCTYHADYL